MALILCATRGGEDSYRTQDKAIQLAKETGYALTFLYIVDMQFLNHTAAPIVVDVESEVAQMGEFLLLIAQERSAKQGVPAGALCLKGTVTEELIHAVEETGAAVLLLGKPGGENSKFRLAELSKLAEFINSQTGVDVRIT